MMELEELISGKKEKSSRSWVKILIASILIVLITGTAVFALTAFNEPARGAENLPEQLLKLDVAIWPQECKLYPGETQVFEALVNNGTAPFTYRWEANGTFLGDKIFVEFKFDEPANYAVLSITVNDANGAYGYDSVLVYDPAFGARERYLECVWGSRKILGVSYAFQLFSRSQHNSHSHV